MSGIYFHIPFCKRVCGYCDFYKTVRTELIPRVLERMEQELCERRDFLHDRRIRTLYFGGGTPSLCTPQQIGALVRRAGELFDCSAVGECTLEANPDDLTPAMLEALPAAGVDRLSIGIQSFDDALLRLMNRRHTAAQGEEAILRAQRAGFRNIAADLIFGVEGFGADTLSRTLDRLLSLGVQHLSAYHLTIESGTPFARRAELGKLHPVSERTSEREFLLVHDRLTAAGFEHYEVSNFALAGFRSRHNSSYWTGAEYLGIGPAAHSYDGERRRWSTDTAESYAAGGAFRFEEETLTATDRRNEYLMTRLRTSDGILLDRFAEEFGEPATGRLLRLAAPFLQSGVLTRTGGRLAMEPSKFLVSDHLIGTLFE